MFNKSRNLFALNIAKKTKLGKIILTEGYMDTIALHQAGFDCAVASLGTSLTEDHVKLISNYTKEVIISYDGDQAGINAAQRAIGLLEKSGIDVKVLRVTGAKDPDEFIKTYGPAAFGQLLEGSTNHNEYQLNQIKANYDLTQDDQRVDYLKEAAAFVARLDSPVEREVYGTRAAEAAGLTPAAMAEEVKRLRAQRRRKVRRQEERRALSPAQESQPAERSLRYQNVPSARAEEGVIHLLMLDGENFQYASALQPEHFSSPCWGKCSDCCGINGRGQACTMASSPPI